MSLAISRESFKLTPSPPTAESFDLDSLERLPDKAWYDACDVFQEQKNASLGSVTISQHGGDHWSPDTTKKGSSHLLNTFYALDSVSDIA